MNINWKSKKLWAVVGVVLVFALSLFVFVKKEREDTSPVDIELGASDVNTEGQATDDILQKPTQSTSKKSTSLATTKALSYQAALAKYKDYRLQIDANCSISPFNVTYKNNTTIMLDNRSSITKKVTIGTTYTIYPYDFKLVKLSSATLPKTFLVDCSGKQNVATILLQK